MDVIKIKNFTKKYGDFVAVSNMNLSIEQGFIVGFVGKNGAGKSTTIRSMLNMINPTEGNITILGLDSVKKAKEIKSKVSYFTSEPVFYDNITCDELLKFTLKFTNATVEDMKKLADYFELDLSKKVNELSLGNRKKVSLIQGFIKNSEILILDEPTNGLDPLMQNKFFELLLKEKSKGKTIFLSSHNLTEIEKYCDKVAIIKDGIIVDYFDMTQVKIQHKQVVTYTTENGKKESYVIEEDINSLIKKLSQLNLETLEIQTKTIEDEFIDYFKN